MRIPVDITKPKRIVDARNRPHFVFIQVFDPINVFFSIQTNGFDLERVDAGNNPVSGFVLTNTSQPFKIDSFVGEIWMRAATVVEPEIVAVPL